MAERKLAAETADIGTAISDLFPKFYLTGALGLESGNTASFFDAASKTWSLGPTMRWAIFQGGQVRANIKAQKAQSNTARLQYEQTVLNVLKEVDSALVEHRYERETAQRLELAVNEIEKSVELSRTLNEEGLTDFLTVLDAEARLTLVEDQLVQSKNREWTSLIRLYKSMGSAM